MQTTSCQQEVGTLISLQGQAQMLSGEETVWLDIQAGYHFCPGDTLRVQKDSRAAVLLPNQSVLRIDEHSSLRFPEVPDNEFSVIELLKGFLHIFSHRPRSLKVVTPYVSGAVEGTEFLVKVKDEQCTITVFEGLVVAANAQGELRVGSGQSLQADATAPPRYVAAIRPRDAIHWTLYYPTIIERSQSQGFDAQADPLQEASLLCAHGRVDQAQALLEEVQQKEPENAEAQAQLAVIAIVQNKKDKGLVLAEEAVHKDGQSPAAALALSYAKQAYFDIPGAIAALEQQRATGRQSTLIQIRLAELLLASEQPEAAAQMAREALRHSPRSSLAHTIQGFAAFAQLQYQAAGQAFSRALALDGSSSYAHLGQGLALIQQGNLAEGRAALELAVALDPGNALIRSYLGKAFYEEKRDRLAKRQYDIAKELDPADPTPWLYDALRKQSLNQPGAALRDLEQSMARNDNRAVFRSRLLLDQDLAIRSINLAQIYQDLNFQDLARSEAIHSLNSSPANASSHRFLSEAYADQSRYSIVWASERLQAQLLDPVNAIPVYPQSSQTGLASLTGVHFQDTSYNEYTSLFQRNQLQLTDALITGSHDTLGNELILSGLWNQFSGSISTLHYASDGIRENNDQEQDLLNLYAKYALSHRTTLLVEYRENQAEYGDLQLRFDGTSYPDDRYDDDSDSIRLGLHHTLAFGSDLLFTLASAHYDYHYALLNTGSIDASYSPYSAELQHILTRNRYNLINGISRYADGSRNQSRFGTYSWDSESYDTDSKWYSYANVYPVSSLLATLGISLEKIEGAMEQTYLNPKVGLSWKPTATTTLRAGALHTLRGLFINDQTLEPSQIAGFNQYYNDPAGIAAWQYGIGIDQKWPSTVATGAEIRWRDVTYTELLGETEKEYPWNERTISGYLQYLPLESLSLTARYIHEEYDRDPSSLSTEGVTELTTDAVPLSANLYLPSGFILQLTASHVHQKGRFRYTSMDPVSAEQREDFWITDAAVRYRLPNRIGMASLEVKNLFNTQFRFQSMDLSSPEYSSEQWILGKLTLTF